MDSRKIITGEVTYGRQLGSTIGFPTANVIIPTLDGIKRGVYAVLVSVDGHIYNGVANVGHHPTVGNSETPLIEAFIFDFNQNIYGKTISVELFSFIREERKFTSIKELKVAIAEDVKQAKVLLSYNI